MLTIYLFIYILEPLFSIYFTFIVDSPEYPTGNGVRPADDNPADGSAWDWLSYQHALHEGAKPAAAANHAPGDDLQETDEFLVSSALIRIVTSCLVSSALKRKVANF